MSALLAARLGDQVGEHGHGWMGMLLGAAAGVVIGAVIIGAAIATGGAALIVASAFFAAGTAMGAASLGARVGRDQGGGSPCGEINEGSANTIIEKRRAARAMLDHAKDGSKLVAQGSTKVQINKKPAARITDKVKCGGKIITSAVKTLIGGDATDAGKMEDELQEWIDWLDFGSATCFVVGGAIVLGAAVAAGTFVATSTTMALTIGGLKAAHWVAETYGGKNAGYIVEGLTLAMPLMHTSASLKGWGKFFGGKPGVEILPPIAKPALEAPSRTGETIDMVRGPDGKWYAPSEVPAARALPAPEAVPAPAEQKLLPAPRVEAPRVEAPKVEAPKVEAPKVEEPSTTPEEVWAPKPAPEPTRVATPVEDAPARHDTPTVEQVQTAIKQIEAEHGIKFGQDFLFLEGSGKGGSGVREKMDALTNWKDGDPPLSMPQLNSKGYLIEGHHTAVALQLTGEMADAAQMIKDGAINYHLDKIPNDLSEIRIMDANGRVVAGPGKEVAPPAAAEVCTTCDAAAKAAEAAVPAPAEPARDLATAVNPPITTAREFFEGVSFTTKVEKGWSSSSKDFKATPASLSREPNAFRESLLGRDSHAIPYKEVAAMGEAGHLDGSAVIDTPLQGDGVVRTRLRLPTEYAEKRTPDNSKQGYFELVRDPDGTINHAAFKEDPDFFAEHAVPDAATGPSIPEASWPAPYPASTTGTKVANMERVPLSRITGIYQGEVKGSVVDGKVEGIQAILDGNGKVAPMLRLVPDPNTEGGLAVIDGSHTFAAYRELGVTDVPGHVYISEAVEGLVKNFTFSPDTYFSTKELRTVDKFSGSQREQRAARDAEAAAAAPPPAELGDGP